MKKIVTAFALAASTALAPVGCSSPADNFVWTEGESGAGVRYGYLHYPNHERHGEDVTDPDTEVTIHVEATVVYVDRKLGNYAVNFMWRPRADAELEHVKFVRVNDLYILKSSSYDVVFDAAISFGPTRDVWNVSYQERHLDMDIQRWESPEVRQALGILEQDVLMAFRILSSKLGGLHGLFRAWGSFNFDGYRWVALTHLVPELREKLRAVDAQFNRPGPAIPPPAPAGKIQQL